MSASGGKPATIHDSRHLGRMTVSIELGAQVRLLLPHQSLSQFVRRKRCVRPQPEPGGRRPIASGDRGDGGHGGFGVSSAATASTVAIRRKSCGLSSMKAASGTTSRRSRYATKAGFAITRGACRSDRG